MKTMSPKCNFQFNTLVKLEKGAEICGQCLEFLPIIFVHGFHCACSTKYRLISMNRESLAEYVKAATAFFVCCNIFDHVSTWWNVGEKLCRDLFSDCLPEEYSEDC
jgi:hypothetical protein